MIEIQITDELIVDLLTPGVCGPVECVNGLPKDCVLLDITLDKSTGLLTCRFDDGAEEISRPPIAFIRPEGLE